MIHLDRPDRDKADEGLAFARELARETLRRTKWPQWLIVGRRRRALHAFLREAEAGALILVASGHAIAARADKTPTPDAWRGKLRGELEQIGGSKAAIALVEWTLKRHEPLDAPTSYNLACCYALLGDQKKMLAALRDAIVLDPGLRRTAERDPILEPYRTEVLKLLVDVLGKPPQQQQQQPAPPPPEADRVVTVRVVRAPDGAVSATMALDEGERNGA